MIPSSTSRWLLLDLGNTRLKWAWTRDGRIEDVAAVAHAGEAWRDAVAAAWRGAPAPRRILLAAVAATAVVDAVRELAAGSFPGVAPESIQSPGSADGWRSAYAEPARLGVDRYLAMRGAMSLQSGAVLVAGCGTAVAIDVVDARGLHRGGLIAPGPALMRESILVRTGRVDWRREGAVRWLGADTEDALQSGCWQAAAGLIEHVAAAAARELGAAPALLLHGGDAPRVAGLLGIAARIEPELVFEGMLRHAR